MKRPPDYYIVVWRDGYYGDVPPEQFAHKDLADVIGFWRVWVKRA